MKKATRKAAIWLIAMGLVSISAIFLMTRTSIVETVKKETAKLFVYEHIPNQNVQIDSCLVATAADSIYKDFRKKYRFHYQTIGLANFADSSRLILLSDLPPHFEADSIPVIFSKFTHKMEMRKHPIGYDGYVTDLLISLGNATTENCMNLIKKLNKELFFSDYKPVVTPLPVEEKRQYFAKENIDYQITLDEFNTWFMEDAEGFMTLEDTSSILSIADLFAQQSRGVYFSQLPGFVAWAIAKNADISEHQHNIRQFTLDADLILGALADSSTLVIIGRERQSPLNELPPLQIESILLLASTTEKELSQSLDINDLMAGKMNNGKDWCPTYLSRELENTEFGDLMTITDVLLKDWSERGTIQEGYYRYPEPGYYPFDKPLFRKLGLSELVYNWNTAGAMYAIDCEGYTIYTLNRTGSLPVSYFNSQERSESIGYRYESQAYHYFATLCNTDLARVVQYTALYQLFIDNNISYSGETYPAFPKNKPFLLYKPTTDLLTIFKNLSNEEISRLADSLSQRSFKNYQKEHVDKQLRENERNYNMSYSEENIDFIYQNVHRNTKAGISEDLSELKNMLSSLNEEQFKRLAKFLSYPRGISVRDRESYNTLLRARKVNKLMREIGKNNLDLFGMDLSNVKNYFAGNLSKSAGRYLKTSSLIITFNDLLTTGGHNLSSRISRVNSMTHYKQSKGNYVPKDYDRPAGNEPVLAEKKPVSSQPSASTPSASKPTSGTAPSSKPNGSAAPGSGSRPSSSATPSGSRPSGTAAPSGSKPSASTPSTSKPAGSSSPSSHPSTTSTSSARSSSSASSTTSRSSSGGGNVRPRSAVISTAARGTRGL
ncbi:MAG: hypothetical protein J5644_06855 [Bacteroidales bacterium]|nr:hypothetical protein [Bacteroidales bacterium]